MHILLNANKNIIKDLEKELLNDENCGIIPKGKAKNICKSLKERRIY